MASTEVVVIGGGAAGFFGAIHAAQSAHTHVTLLEAGRQPLAKIKLKPQLGVPTPMLKTAFRQYWYLLLSTDTAVLMASGDRLRLHWSKLILSLLVQNTIFLSRCILR